MFARSFCFNRYLAFCPDEARATLVTQLSAMKNPATDTVAAIRALPGTIVHARAAGFASSPPETDNAAVGLAVPVMQGNQVKACVFMRYLSRAMTEAEAANRYLGDLRATADAIAEAARPNRR